MRPNSCIDNKSTSDYAEDMARKKRRGRQPLPDHMRRVAFTVRIPGGLLEEFKELCDQEDPGEQTRVVEAALRRYVARNKKGG